MTHHNFWRGARIRLRAVEQRDLDAIISSTEEPDSEIDRAEDGIHFPASPEQARAALEELGRKRDDDTFFWVIETLEGQTVGFINTFDCDQRAGAFKYALIVRRPFWGRGYGREAITIVLRYYFRELRYQKCTVLIYSFNTRSLRLHEKLGFIQEGRLRRVVFTNGRHYDEIYYGLTAEEFDQLDPRQELPESAKAE